MKKLILLIVPVFLIAPNVADAYQVNYASVEDIVGDEVILKYRTTDGYTFSVCDFSGQCGELLYDENEDNDAPQVFPEILGKTDYEKSVDGHRAVVKLAEIGDNTYRALYAVDGDDSSFISLIPYNGPSIRTSITYANDAVVFVGNGGEITRYQVSTGKISEISTEKTYYPYISLSEHGKYITAYYGGDDEHKIWNLINGKEMSISTETPSYVVFDNREERVAYLEEVDGFKKLFVAPIDDLEDKEEVNEGDYTVVEYEFIGDTLYYIANSEEGPSGPYIWNLYSYDPESGETEVVDSDVGYDDWYGNLKKTHSALMYEKVDGTNKNVIIYEPDAREGEKRTVLSAVEPREASDKITRTAVDLDGVPGVLLTPEGETGELPLIVWLHGGPMRQTSIGYHTFYGYAVYDEFLERFAEEANVLKIDYAGSWGHGEELRERLDDNLGVADVSDVLKSIEEIKKERDISNVYLLGNSYGGYLGARTLVEDPEEIDAVVSLSGVLDWESLISRIPSSPFKTYFDGTPNRDNEDKYEAASIMSRLDNIDDEKILLVYGEDDATVPTWQSTEFYSFAEEEGKNVELVNYEEEGHTILKSENLLDLCQRTAEVFSLSESLCEI
ncbi:MAG: alpha/beta fold hydrolase [Candidatus Campbellbacteria bacterium]|nr:alpha/beta fold hydrolase [Candidatus Campbellbacteria bacterium]